MVALDILMMNSLIGILIFVRFVSCFIVGVLRYNKNVFKGACFANGLNITQFPWAIQLSSFVKLEIGRKYPFFAKAQKHRVLSGFANILKVSKYQNVTFIKWEIRCLSDPNYAHKCLFHCIGKKLNY